MPFFFCNLNCPQQNNEKLKEAQESYKHVLQQPAILPKFKPSTNLHSSPRASPIDMGLVKEVKLKKKKLKNLSL